MQYALLQAVNGVPVTLLVRNLVGAVDSIVKYWEIYG